MRGYFDHAATSPLRAEVKAALVEAMDLVGNPSSIHSAGQQARELLEAGRERVAASLGADPMEVVLTGGGTEAVNFGIKGLYWARASAQRRRILATRAEHHATLDSLDWLARHEGAVIDWVPVDELGRIRLEALAARIEDDPGSVALITALWANNEVGTLQPVPELSALAAVHGIPLHLDAVAAYGSVPVDAHATGAAAISVSAHKVGGPVGVGALVLARDAVAEALLHGGEQQRARSGTMDVVGAHAFGAAAELVGQSLAAPGASQRDEVRVLRDRLIARIHAAVPDAVLRGDPHPDGRLPGNAHFTFPGCEGDSLLYLLDMAGFSVSTGSACQAGVPEVSHVLRAMGVDEGTARGALRFTLGPGVDAPQVDALVAALPDAVARARVAGLASRPPLLGR